MKVSSFSDDCLSLEIETNPGHGPEHSELFEFQIDAKKEKSDKRLMGDNISSCEEVNVTDVVEDLQRTKLDDSRELNGFEEHENVDSREIIISDSEKIDSEAACTEKSDSFVPIDVISNAVRTRRSILRRTSSTSTDDSQGDENEFNGVPDSPSKKNVRFNLNPNVRVFSNRKDKKKRKLEAKLKAEARKHSLESEGSGSEQSNGTSPVDNGTGWDGFIDESLGTGSNGILTSEESDKREQGGDIQSRDDAVDKQIDANESFGMTNNLIFELDD